MKIPASNLVLLLMLIVQAGKAQNSGFGVYQPDSNVSCLTHDQHKAIVAKLTESRAQLIAQGILPDHNPMQRMITLFSWPVEQHNDLDDYGVHGISNFVDQNTNTPDQILDYNCGARSYDLPSGYNHGGIDIFLWPFAWYKMEHDQVKVVAAAPGVIIFKEDGNFDKNCGFNSSDWNAVYVQHEDGSVAWYGHMKNGSVTSKDVGLSVERGEYLGIVGSSGSSTAPHLHFEIHTAAGGLVDPYTGPCNTLNSESWWIEQRPYFDSGINALRTQSSPTDFPPCPQTEVPFEKNTWCGGDLVYFVNYLRDQLPGQGVQYTIRRPNGSVWQQWDQTMTDYYSASWWWWNYTLPPVANTGTWTFQAMYEGELYERAFDVIGLSVIQPDGSTNICPGESVTLQAPVGEYGFDYQWQLDGSDILGATGSSYTATTGGIYTVVVSSPGLCSTTSNSLTVTLLPEPNVSTVPPEGPAYVCAGLTMTVCAAPFQDYLWNTGEASQCITAVPGDYIVTVTTEFGCIGVSETVTIWEIENPVVDLGPDSLIADVPLLLDAANPGLSYAWNTGDVSQTILVEETGWYSVIVFDDNGCAGIDSIFVEILMVSVPEAADRWVTTYPNPANEMLLVNLKDVPVNASLVIYDIFGRELARETLLEASPEVNIRNLAPGIYITMISNRGRQTVSKLVVEK